MDEAGVTEIQAIATSVVREANNGPAFAIRVRESIGIDLKVVSGETEAALATRGALLPVSVPFDNTLIVDIGGGSTEFIFTDKTSPLFIQSTDLGVVRLTENLLHHDPPSSDEIDGVRRFINDRTTAVKKQLYTQGFTVPFTSNVLLIGIAGTPTTMAAMDLQLEEYDRERVTNHTLSQSRIRSLFQRLCDKSSTQRLTLPGMQQGREDLIIPGMLITLQVMETFELDPLRVIDSGILEGLILMQEPIDSIL